MGTVLLSAAELGVSYRYFSRYAVHDPAWTYLTTDEGVAAGFASRYCARDGRVVPGDVYEVEPVGALHPDPDNAWFPDVFLRCRRARIIRVVASGLSLTADEQREREWRYRVWGRADAPVWNSDGTINPSEQMLSNGVTREWTALLRPWLDPEDFDAKGKLTVALRAARNPTRDGEPWRTILDVVPVLDRDCQVRELVQGDSVSYECLGCGRRLGDRDQAAVHQLGEHALRLIARIHGWENPQELPAVIGGLARAAIDRNQTRWQWLLGQS
ncbi:hypothetical protein PV646_02945 [Streptomyces sp. ID05-26A]|nr:hypothetical protein [Streptomyces sp. ID05-26A]